jgi:hypothetical protein
MPRLHPVSELASRKKKKKKNNNNNNSQDSKMENETDQSSKKRRMPTHFEFELAWARTFSIRVVVCLLRGLLRHWDGHNETAISPPPQSKPGASLPHRNCSLDNHKPNSDQETKALGGEGDRMIGENSGGGGRRDGRKLAF